MKNQLKKVKQEKWEIKFAKEFPTLDCDVFVYEPEPYQIRQFIRITIEEEKKQIKKDFIRLAKDHYWDSLTPVEEIIYKHIKYILSLLK